MRKRPLFIIMPWINKFYVLDLQPKNSFIKWAVDQGHTVFVPSWVNPDERLAQTTFEDYMTHGLIDAFNAIEAATGEHKFNAIGYCLGGTMLNATIAYLTAHGDDRIVSATNFVTLVDFTDVGDMGVFVDEQQISSVEKRMQEHGYLDAADMAMSFNMLRANDLIWSFVVNNYLLGKDPAPFDLLYWNADATRMPAVMHSYYMRNMYQKNLLKEPGGITLAGTPIDLRTIKTPMFLLSCKRGPSRAVEVDLRGDAALFGARHLRAGGLRTSRRRDQPARQQIRPLDQRQAARDAPTNGSRAPRRKRGRGGRCGTSG